MHTHLVVGSFGLAALDRLADNLAKCLGKAARDVGTFLDIYTVHSTFWDAAIYRSSMTESAHDRPKPFHRVNCIRQPSY
jgi:hypothetical protein